MMIIQKIVRFRSLLCAVVLWSAQCGAGAAIPPPAGGTMPEALKNIPQASGTCHKDDVATSPAAAAPALRADMSCAIDAGTAQQRQNAVMIDVRPAGEYESFHIGGSISASLSDLRSKPYWRNKATLLVGSGKAERELYVECTRLKQLGYKEVMVLRGGMPAWIAANQPVTGRAPSARQLARLSASEFWLESQNPDNLLVISQGQAALQKNVPFAVVLPQMTAAAIRSTLERRRKAFKNAPLASVIMAVDAKMPESQIEQLQQAMLPIPLLIYTETGEAFTTQLAVQKAVWLAQARGPKQPACGQ